MAQESGYQFSDEESNLFRFIAEHIRTNHSDYKQAGKWLDEYCSESAYWSRKKDELERLKKNRGTLPEGLYQRDVASLEKEITEKRTLPPLIRFNEAKKYFTDKYKDLELIQKDDAKKIILITWLITDPDAENTKLNITEFENWIWEPLDDVSKLSRGFTSFLFSQNKDLWLRLAKIAWEKANVDSREKSDLFRKTIEIFKSKSLWETVIAGLIVAIILAMWRYFKKNQPELPIDSNRKEVVIYADSNSISQTPISDDISQVLEIDNSSQVNRPTMHFVPGLQSNIIFAEKVTVINYMDGLPKAENPEIKTLFEKAKRHYDNKEFEIAIKEFSHCLEISEDSEKRGALNLLIGNCYYSQKLYIKAHDYYARGLKESQKAKDLEGIGSSLASIAATYSNRPTSNRDEWEHNRQKAVEIFNNALKIFNKDDFPVHYAIVQTYLGNTYRDLQMIATEDRSRIINTAIKCYTEASKICNKEEYPHRYAEIQYDQGVTYILMKYETGKEQFRYIRTAIDCLQNALDIYSKDENPDMYTSTQDILGTAYFMLTLITDEEKEKNINKSIECHKSALKTVKREKDPRYYAHLQRGLGHSYVFLALMSDEIKNRNISINAAIECYKAAQKIYKNDRDRNDYAMTVNEIGAANIYLLTASSEERIRNINISIGYYREALSICKKEESPNSYWMIAANMGSALATIDSPETCYWLNEAFSLREYMTDKGKHIEELIQQHCKKEPNESLL